MTLLERMARAWWEASNPRVKWEDIDGPKRAGVLLHVGRLQRMAETGDPRLAEFATNADNAAALAVLREEQAPAFDGGKSMERRKRDQAPPPPCAACGGAREVHVIDGVYSKPCPDCARGAR